MPSRKRPGKPAGAAGSTIPGVKALLQSCLKSMSVEVERLSDDQDEPSLRKAFDDALIRASGLKRNLEVPALPGCGNAAAPGDPKAKGLDDLCSFFNRDCFTLQENFAAASDGGGPPAYETDAMTAAAIKKGVPMVEVRIVLASIAQNLQMLSALRGLFVINSPADDFAVVIHVNATRMWDSAAGPVPILDVAYMHVDKRRLKDNTDAITQLVQHVHGSGADGVFQIKTQFTTDGAKALALVLDRNASILGSKTCEKLKQGWDLPPAVCRRMHASALLPIKVLSVEEVKKVETWNGRTCAACGGALPTTASKCSACHEVSYCGADCQRVHWPQHKRTCRKTNAVSFEGAVEVEHGHKPFGKEWMSKPTCHASTMSMNGSMPKDTPHIQQVGGQKLPAMPASGFIVKVQVGLENPAGGPIIIYPRGKRFETFVPVGMPAHTPLLSVVQLRGFRGLKAYLWAKREADQTLLVNVNDLPDQDQGW